MAQKQEPEVLGTAMSRTEQFFEKNSKTMVIVLISLFVIAAAIFGVRQLIIQPRLERAAEMIAQPQYLLESSMPDYELALNGDANGAGFLEVIEQYGSTPSGNLARHYAGLCYLHLGELELAADYLAQYNHRKGIPAQIINAQNYGLQGDIAVEQGDYTKAVKLFEQAVNAADNALTAPLYLRKAALAANAAGDAELAAGYAQQILDRYPTSVEARSAEKMIGTTKH